jgi:hypothetical protein
MSLTKIVGFIMIAVGFYVAIQGLFGIYLIAVGPPAPNFVAMLLGIAVFVLLPGGIGFLLIKYGRRQIA